MADARPFASILVRAHNDAAFIERTLAGVFAQKVDFPFEVVVCDDASTDATRVIAARFPVRFVERPDGPYKPGRTLNALVREAAYARLMDRCEKARGEFVRALEECHAG